jgi:N-acyl-D-aspartate/D-glutamate deacylase
MWTRILLVTTLVLFLSCVQSQRFDVLIKGGRLIDGTGAPARLADVGIKDDIIVALGDLNDAVAEKKIEAGGLVVSPGFIDMHSHSDFRLLVDGRGLSKVMDGVTTELLGESSSAGPVMGPARSEREKSLKRLELSLDWTTLGEYFERLERQGMSVNILSTVGSGLIRASVVGYDNRPATSEELERMAKLVGQAMQEGAVGLSSGLIYPPNQYASTEELIRMAEVAAEHGGIYLTHIRGEGDKLLEALKEAIEIGREADLPVEVLHFKRAAVRLDGEPENPSIQDAVALIEQAQQNGVKIYANMYPYSASQTGLGVRLPDWVHEGGREKLLERLRNPQIRARIRIEVNESLSQGIASRTPDTIMFGSTPYEPHRRFLGMRIDAIAREMKIKPAEAIIELIEKADGGAGAIYFGMREEDVRFGLMRPWTTIGSDGAAVAPEGILAQSHPHPRWYGTFSRVLGHYVREEQIMTLPEAIRKMTSLPASRLGLVDRGIIAVGKKADLVIFDADAIIDKATFTEPHQFSEGIQWLLINGQLVIAEGRHTGAMPGRVLRGSSS